MTFSTLLWLARSELRTAPARSRGLLLAVVLGATLVVAATTLGTTLQQRVDRGAGVEHARTDLVLRSDGGAAISPDDVRRIAEVPGVAALGALVRTHVALSVGDDVREVLVESVPPSAFRWQGTSQGRLPRTDDEVALSAETLRDLRLEVGDRVALGTPAAGRTVFRVVGELDVHGSLRYGATGYGMVSTASARAFAGTTGFHEVQLRVAPGAQVDAVIAETNARVPVGYPTATADLVAATEQLYGTGLTVLSGLITGFALVSGLVAALVVATVVAASLPGRRARLALLRAVGADRRALSALVGLETGSLALLGALVAVPLGVGVAAGALPLVGLLPGVPHLTSGDLRVPASLALVPPAAVALGLLAVLVPAWRAGRVAPAEALRTGESAPGAFRSWPRAMAAVVALVVLVLAAAHGSLLLTAAAGVLVAITFVAATPALYGGSAALAARLIRDRSPVGALAAAQLRRFPARASATGVASSVAATLLALSWVALGSIAATVDDRTAHDSGPRLMVGAYAGGGPVDAGTWERLAAVDGVARVVPIASSAVTLEGPRAAGGGTTRVAGNVVATDVDALAAVTGDRFVLDEVRPDTVYLPSSDLAPFAPGTVRLVGPDGHRDLRVRYVDDLPFQALVAPAAVAAVGAGTEARAAWIDLAAGADRRTVLDAVQVVAVEAGGLPVSGSVTAQVRVDRAIALARGLATAMLGLSVLIAVLGAALTIATTMRERAGELATLRLLGMEAGAVRRLVAAETWATGALSVLVGLLLGAVLGRAAVTSTAEALGLALQVRVPVLPLLGLGLLQLLVLRIAVIGPVTRVSTLSPLRALRGAPS